MAAASLQRPNVFFANQRRELLREGARKCKLCGRQVHRKNIISVAGTESNIRGRHVAWQAQHPQHFRYFCCSVSRAGDRNTPDAFRLCCFATEHRAPLQTSADATIACIFVHFIIFHFISDPCGCVCMLSN